MSRRLARLLRIGAKTAVEDLHETERAALAERRREAREPGQERVVVDAELPCPPLPVLRDVRRARLDDAESAARSHREPFVLVVRQRAVGVALPVGHRREPDAVLRADAVAE
jgi:hypothetical protein